MTCTRTAQLLLTHTVVLHGLAELLVGRRLQHVHLLLSVVVHGGSSQIRYGFSYECASLATCSGPGICKRCVAIAQVACWFCVDLCRHSKLAIQLDSRCWCWHVVVQVVGVCYRNVLSIRTSGLGETLAHARAGQQQPVGTALHPWPGSHNHLVCITPWLNQCTGCDNCGTQVACCAVAL